MCYFTPPYRPLAIQCRPQGGDSAHIEIHWSRALILTFQPWEPLLLKILAWEPLVGGYVIRQNGGRRNLRQWLAGCYVTKH